MATAADSHGLLSSVNSPPRIAPIQNLVLLLFQRGPNSALQKGHSKETRKLCEVIKRNRLKYPLDWIRLTGHSATASTLTPSN